MTDIERLREELRKKTVEINRSIDEKGSAPIELVAIAVQYDVALAIREVGLKIAIELNEILGSLDEDKIA